MEPLIGRDREMRRLAGLLERATPGRPAVVVVQGPPGSGRGRLLRELAAAGHRCGLTAAWAHPHHLVLRAGEEPVLTATTGHPRPAGGEVHHVRLAPLSPADVHRLVAALVGRPPSGPLLDLARVAAGRPGDLSDLVDGLRAEGGRIRLPERTRARLADRLATLPPSARHLVQAATALRSPFPVTRLAGLLRCSPVALLPDLEEALDSGLLVAAGEALAFSHDLVRPIVEESMPRALVAALREVDHGRRRRAVPVPRPVRSGPVDWAVLSDRELQIAELVGQALTNQQIAHRVSRSPHTVNYHLRQIFRKLGLASRVELASLLRGREAR
jgi:DNA-binding CsgD family transcriptional regulator